MTVDYVNEAVIGSWRTKVSACVNLSGAGLRPCHVAFWLVGEPTRACSR